MLPIRDHEPSERAPIVTVALIGLNIFVFWQELTAASIDAFVQQWALVPALLDFSEPLTLLPLVTSQFLHAGFAHILFNMWYLWIFGDNIEGRFGHVTFLAFYLFAGVVAGLAQLFFTVGSSVPMLGASGAVAGVLGAYLVLFAHHRVDTFWPDLFFFGWSRMTLPAGAVLFFWFVSQLFSGTASLAVNTAATSGVAWWAHIGGFVFGWVIAQFFRRPRRQLALA